MSFTIHIAPERDGWAVWIAREWSQGPDTSRHSELFYRDLMRAEIAAMALTETHGDCAVVLH
jgi:hypothetical protein